MPTVEQHASKRTKISIEATESLELDYVVENIHSDSEEEGEEEVEVQEVLEYTSDTADEKPVIMSVKEVKEVKAAKGKKAKPIKQFKSRHTYEELGFEFAELPLKERIPNYNELLSKLYLTKPKPLIVKRYYTLSPQSHQSKSLDCMRECTKST
jgi:hypothetical protein